MHPPSPQHTLFLFEKLYADMPPAVPETIQQDMAAALQQLRHNVSLPPQEMEETLISFGKKLWPYRKAFDEFYDVYEGELGELFLLGHLAPSLKKRYQEFLVYGGGFRDVHSGRPMTFFAPEERTELVEALSAVGKEVRAHTIQAVGSTEREAYEARIVEFQMILDDIETRLNTLRRMADDEQEHPELAAEIRAQIKAFEEGLCLLGPNASHKDVAYAPEHFVGRKSEKKMRQRVHAR